MGSKLAQRRMTGIPWLGRASPREEVVGSELGSWVYPGFSVLQMLKSGF